jgi:hypothetical protein
LAWAAIATPGGCFTEFATRWFMQIETYFMAISKLMKLLLAAFALASEGEVPQENTSLSLPLNFRGKRVGRARIQRIPDASAESLEAWILANIACCQKPRVSHLPIPIMIETVKYWPSFISIFNSPNKSAYLKREGTLMSVDGAQRSHAREFQLTLV